MVTFDLFARPVVEALAGAPLSRLPAAQARLAKEIKTRTGLTRFLPGILSGGVYDARVEVVSWQGSGDLMAIARANCYVVIPSDKEHFAAGDMISVVMR
jgi:molybdopterin molybdotransferase